jgi:hypothetical protein
MHTERITYLANAEQKAALEAFARARGESVGNVVREAVADYMAQPTEEEMAEFAALVAEVEKAVPEMHATLDRCIESLAETHREIRATLKQLSTRK